MTENNKYFLRCTSQDYADLKALGALLGVITIRPEQVLSAEVPLEGGGFETITQTLPELIEAPGGCWDFVGKLTEPTGEWMLDPEFGPQEIRTTIKDINGEELIHINVSTPRNIRQIAEAMALDNPSIAAGLANLGKYFIVDELGNAKAPKNPHRVFAA